MEVCDCDVLCGRFAVFDVSGGLAFSVLCVVRVFRVVLLI